MQHLQKNKGKHYVFQGDIKFDLWGHAQKPASNSNACFKEEYTVFLVRVFTWLLRLCDEREKLSLFTKMETIKSSNLFNYLSLLACFSWLRMQ